MVIDPHATTPLYLQVKMGIEDGILSDVYEEEAQVPSTTEFSLDYMINPATALKGINELVDEDILYKKRGIGVFVQTGAKEKLLNKKKDSFLDSHIRPMLNEAKNIGLGKEDIKNMIDQTNMEVNNEGN